MSQNNYGALRASAAFSHSWASVLSTRGSSLTPTERAENSIYPWTGSSMPSMPPVITAGDLIATRSAFLPSAPENG